MQQVHSLETQFKNQFAQAAIDQLDKDHEILQSYISSVKTLIEHVEDRNEEEEELRQQVSDLSISIEQALMRLKMKH